jgi:hypothetical protein
MCKLSLIWEPFVNGLLDAAFDGGVQAAAGHLTQLSWIECAGDRIC